MQTFSDVGIDVGSRSGSFKTQCPRCGGKKDLSVDTDKRMWNCHKPRCNWHGKLRSDARPVQWQSKDYFKPAFVYKEISRKGAEFFAKRDIPLEVLKEFQITADDRSIAFPYFWEGEVVMIKHRGANKKHWTSKQPRKVFWNADKITPDTKTYTICEGEPDCLALATAGIPSASVPFGAPANDATSFNDLDECFRNSGMAFDSIEKIILATDSDAPGRRLEEELARRFGREKCFRVVWPDGCKDANDVLMAHGKEFLRECIDNAAPYPVDGIYEVMSFRDKVMNLYENGLPTAYSTGSFALDHYFTLMPGELTVITGIPGHGKSSFVEWLMVNLIQEHGFKFGLFTPEHEPTETHIARLAELVTGSPFSREQPSHVRMSEIALSTAIDTLQEHCHYVIPDSLNRSVDDILSLSKVLVKREGIKGLILDPWNSISMSDMGGSETHFIRESLDKLRRFARSHQVSIFIVAHPRIQHKDKSGNYIAPNPYEISGSSRWRDMCDNCLCLFREAENDGDKRHEVQCHIQKIKHKFVGKIGMVTFKYEFNSGRFLDSLQAL